mmetsp:Transcript_50492/g.107552  ORF Transcript_50492/g.107552 Transcript_50492/m.107552 type:complete len:121 (+) Transcript_50492:284-646(+)
MKMAKSNALAVRQSADPSRKPQSTPTRQPLTLRASAHPPRSDEPIIEGGSAQSQKQKRRKGVIRGQIDGLRAAREKDPPHITTAGGGTVRLQVEERWTSFVASDRRGGYDFGATSAASKT